MWRLHNLSHPVSIFLLVMSEYFISNFVNKILTKYFDKIRNKILTKYFDKIRNKIFREKKRNMETGCGELGNRRAPFFQLFLQLLPDWNYCLDQAYNRPRVQRLLSSWGPNLGHQEDITENPRTSQHD